MKANKLIVGGAVIGGALLLSPQLKTLFSNLLASLGTAAGNIFSGLLTGATRGVSNALTNALSDYGGFFSEAWEAVTFDPESVNIVSPEAQYLDDFLDKCSAFGFNMYESAVMLRGFKDAELLDATSYTPKLQYYIDWCYQLNHGDYPAWPAEAINAFRFTTIKKISPSIVIDTFNAGAKANLTLFNVINGGAFNEWE